MKKRTIAILLASAMVFAMLAGCGGDSDTGSDSSSDPSDSGSGAVVPSDNPDIVGGDAEETNYILPELNLDLNQYNMDPTKVRGHGPVTYSVFEMLYTTENGIGSDMIPLLADANRGGDNSLGLAGMDHEDGSTEYTFYIYDYITDSAGNKITASDVVFSFETTRDGGQVSGWGPIEGWEAVDDTTVKMTTSRELDQKGELENILLRCCIFSEKAYNDSPSGFTTDAVGTGPYVITDSSQDVYITCEARDDYWQTDESLRPRSAQANVAKFTCYYITDTNTKVVSLQSGDLDMLANNVATTAIGTFLNDDNYQVYSYTANGVNYLDANCSEESIMSDLNMRLAVFYAISNEGVATLLNAAGEVDGYAPLTAFGHELFSDYLTKWDSESNYVTEQDLELSKQYAEAAGYNGESIRLLCNNDSTTMAETILNMLTNAGFTVEMKSYDRNTVTSTRDDPKEWDLYFSLTNSSDYMTSLWSHVMDPASFNGHTENFITDEHYFELLDTAMNVSATDDDLDAFWQYTVENGYICPVFHQINAMVLPAKTVANIWLNDKNTFIPGAAYYTEG